ncbi:uncharacterized protein G2W53_024864 [Senna tora]|uniref:Uncharacterized protein n=1 Tax=Senna tora TaxID=362788 RepID=A0A834WJR5_9FABA|nr:uncharacterized protein G2W53_024864 [Senna tora]
MEANRKRSRGLLKGKLMPFYRAPKPPISTQYGSSKTKAVQSSASPMGIVVHQDYAIAPPKPNKVSFVVVDNGRHLVSQLEEVYGVDDDKVDIKAAMYIATVQERLKLERVNSERKINFQDNQV